MHGVDAEKIAVGLSSYDGIGRRMEKICTTSSGADVYTDYAHHPTEIATTLAGARGICKGKLHVVFQPHTFSRTAELFDDFVCALGGSGADEITLCEIYPAREENIYGVYSSMLSDKINAAGKKCHVAQDFTDAAEYADAASTAGDMIIVMGAGDVIEVAKKFSEKYNK
jgi:UDP-N-acetylmuramate--alanine ligase